MRDIRLFAFELADLLDLGRSFLRWEIAAVVAGSILGSMPLINLNVQESKDNTSRACRKQGKQQGSYQRSRC